MWQKLLKTRDSFPLAIIRLMLGLVMFPHGAQKMLGWFGGHGFSGTMGFFTHQGIPAPLAFLAIAAEFLGGLGLILGFLSRIAAFGVLCNMVVAVLTVHLHNGFFMNWAGTNKGEGFEYHLLAIAMALAVMIGGAGAPSVDRALSGSGPAADRTLP
ncbi:MAG: DoxX family protein [Bryobacteraceae bacterium]|jgi:putative oxidoreductase